MEKLWINWVLAIGLQNFPVLAVNESCTRLVISTKKSNDTYAIEEYDFNSGVLVRSIDCHSGWITCLQFLNDNLVVTGSQGTLRPALSIQLTLCCGLTTAQYGTQTTRSSCGISIRASA
jgi:WD40 repeat protein